METMPLAISVLQDENVRYSLERIKIIADQTQNDELKTNAMFLEELLKKPFANIRIDYSTDLSNHAAFGKKGISYR